MATGNLDFTVAQVNKLLQTTKNMAGGESPTISVTLPSETDARIRADSELTKAILNETTARDNAIKTQNTKIAAIQAAYVSDIAVDDTTGEIKITIG